MRPGWEKRLLKQTSRSRAVRRKEEEKGKGWWWGSSINNGFSRVLLKRLGFIQIVGPSEPTLSPSQTRPCCIPGLLLGCFPLRSGLCLLLRWDGYQIGLCQQSCAGIWLVWNSMACCCYVIDDLTEKCYADIAGLSCSTIGCGQHPFQQLMYKKLSFQMQPKGLWFFNPICPPKMEIMPRVYLIICCFFSLVCSTASPSPCYPTAAAQHKVKNEWCQRRQCRKKMGQRERKEHREVGGRWFGKLQETAEVRSCVLCAGTELQREGGYFTQTQTAVTGILVCLVFALWTSGWHFMAIKTLALPQR